MPEQRMNVELSPEMAAGHYADLAGIWHTAETFVLDFMALTGPAQAVDEGLPEPVLVSQAQVVSRIRIPAAQVFEIMKALEQQLSLWEAETGARPTPPPDS